MDHGGEAMGRAMAASAGYEARDLAQRLVNEIEALKQRVIRLETQVELLKKLR